MNIHTHLTRLAGATLIAGAGAIALAAPSSAMTAPGPDPIGTSDVPAAVSHDTGTADGSIDWSDLGLGLAGGVVLAGVAFGASSTLRRSHRPSVA